MTTEARGGLVPAALRRWIPVAVAVVIVAGAGAYMLARGIASPASPERPAQAAEDVVRFRDEAAGISIVYPAGWERVTSPDPEVRLLAQGDGASMSLRMVDLGIEVDADSLGAAKRLTDRLVKGAGQVKLVRPPSQVTLGGLPGYLYLYTYRDAAAPGGRGAHAHYFLFRGQTLITIVFQTAPAQRLIEFAPLFDRIGETLRVTSA